VVEDCGGRRRSAVAAGFQWVSGDGKGLRRCGSARRSSGRCSFVLKIDGVSESAWQHRRRRSESDGDGASARMEDVQMRERCGKEEKGEAGLGFGSCRGKERRGGACRGGGGHQWP
jgi:hypothetical protein